LEIIFRLDCSQSLCNGQDLIELQSVREQDKGESGRQLQHRITLMKDNPELMIPVQGHTDDLGSVETESISAGEHFYKGDLFFLFSGGVRGAA